MEFLLNAMGEQTPLFVELSLKMKNFGNAFLEHMEEEEQCFFPYLRQLQHMALKLHQILPPDLFAFLNTKSLNTFAEEHEPVEAEFDVLKLEAETLLQHFDCNCITATVLRRRA